MEEIEISQVSASPPVSTFSSQDSIDFASLVMKQLPISKSFYLDAFLRDLEFDPHTELIHSHVEKVVNALDCMQMLQAVEELHTEICRINTEKLILIDFLDKNDPKVLHALRQRRLTDGSLASSGSISSAIQTARSTLTGSSPTSTLVKTKRRIQYYVKYDTKTGMAEKAALQIAKRTKEIGVEAFRLTKIKAAELDEVTLSLSEAEKTVSNFELHFLMDPKDIELLRTGTEQDLDNKFRKFVTNWEKDARVLIATLRMLVPYVQEKCNVAEGTLATKRDMAALLGPVDFEGLYIKRSQIMRVLDEKSAHLHGLKGVTGRASIAMTAEKKKLLMLEAEGQRRRDKTVDIVKAIGRIEAESDLVREKNDSTKQQLQDLKGMLENYLAPSVNQYVDVKDETSTCEREEKILVRKINIMNMKLSLLQQKVKRLHH